jgi:hypothetical protein
MADWSEEELEAYERELTDRWNNATSAESGIDIGRQLASLRGEDVSTVTYVQPVPVVAG